MIALGVAVALVAGATVYTVVAQSGAAKVSHHPAVLARRGPGGPVPSVNMTAFTGHGELAFVSRGTLWLLDGTTRTLRRVAPPGMKPASPVFSRDGRWLAFLASNSSVWLAHGDGSDPRQILAGGGLIGWSPTADLLAITAGNMIRLVNPSGASRPLARAGLWPPVWSPDGRYLAIATWHWPTGSTLTAYPVTGGKPVVWLRLNARRGRLDGMNEIIIDPAGWWARRGIGFWAFGNGMVHNNDQTPLNVITAPGRRPRLFGYTLSDDTAPQAAAAADGRLAIVNNPSRRDIGRIIWQDKQVQVCEPQATGCANVPSPKGTVTLDPAWSPGGKTLAFVRAPSRASPAFPQHTVARWYDAHQLWLYNPVTRSLRRADARGAADPAWSANGKSLLYAARDGIWLLPRISSQPVRISAPLFQPGNWPAYYGQVGWTAQFAWWPG